MNIILAVFKRNVAAYFSGVLGYLFIVVFVVGMAALAYTPEFFANNVASLDQLNEMFPLLLLFIIPAITMGAWSEERKLGTEELLFTLPASDFQIVIAKYLAVLAVYTIALLFSVFQLIVLGWYADPDWGLLFTTYLGYWLAGASLLSAGMFASALTSNATVAYVLGALVCAIPVFIGEIPGVREFLPVLQELSLSQQFREFAVGMVPLNGVVYFVSLTAFMLYLNLVMISKRHWSGDNRANMGLQFGIRTLCLIVVLISLNMITRASADTLNLRADLTADNVYTLSDTTRKVLKDVNDDRPVTIQAFLSEEVPQEYVTLRKRLVGLLRQYDRIGGAQVEVRIVDVKRYSTEAEEAESFGVTSRQVQTETGGRFAVNELMLGVVVSSPLDETVIPDFEVDSPIEYELTRAVRTVSTTIRRTVGVLKTDVNINGGFDMSAFHNLPSWAVVNELKKQYNVVDVSPDSPYDEQRRLFIVKEKADVTNFADDLDAQKLPDGLREKYADDDKVALPEEVEIEVVRKSEKWRVTGKDPEHKSTIVKQAEELLVYGGYDVLMVAMPSSLSEPQMLRLVREIKDGQPTLIFDDPVPLTALQHAPTQPKRAPGGPFARNQPPPTPRASGGKATALMNALGMRWDGVRTFTMGRFFAALLEDADRLPQPIQQVYERNGVDPGFGATVTVVDPGREWRVLNEQNGHESTIRLRSADVVVEYNDLTVAWDNFNPHPKIDELVPPEFLLWVGTGSGVDSAFNPKSLITKNMDQALMVFPGRLKPVKGGRLEFDALLRTGTDSGEIAVSQILAPSSSPFGGGVGLRRDPPRIADDDAHVLAAHIYEKADGKSGDDSDGAKAAERAVAGGLNVVYVADLDFISNTVLVGWPELFRRQFDEEYDVDNLAFVFNSIDVLSGAFDSLELRGKRAKSRPLTRIQEQINKFREQRQEEIEKAEEKFKKDIDEAQARLDEVQEKIRKQGVQTLGEALTAMTTLQTEDQREQRKLKRLKEENEEKKQREVDRLKGEEMRKVEALQTRIRWQAVLLPPLPAILLGIIVLGVRLYRERSEIDPRRQARQR